MHRIKENFNSILKIFKQILSTIQNSNSSSTIKKKKVEEYCLKRNEIKLQKE